MRQQSSLRRRSQNCGHDGSAPASPATSQPGRGRACSRLRHLHLGLDRRPEGRGGHARQPGGAGALDGGRVRTRPRRPDRAVRLAELRRARRGDLPGARRRRPDRPASRRRGVAAGLPGGLARRHRARPADGLLAPAGRPDRRDRLAGCAAPGHPRRAAGERGRGRPLARAVRQPGAAGQHVRADRGDDHRHRRRPGRRRRAPADRQADRRDRRPGARPRRAPRSAGRRR